MRARLALALLLPGMAGAQAISISAPTELPAARVLRDAVAHAHVLRAGPGAVDLPQGSAERSSLIVLRGDATIAGRVDGDVVVVGGNLIIHPGADIRGRAVAIGGIVMPSGLAQVQGAVRSYEDVVFVVRNRPDGIELAYQAPGHRAAPRLSIEPAGLQGLLVPSYDRVDGVSMPVGLEVSYGAATLTPTLTYRSRIGIFDPRIDLRVGSDTGWRVEAFAGELTRSNDEWIYGDLINSALSLFAGQDVRNYFRSGDGDARAYYRSVEKGRVIEPYIGGRFEHTQPITNARNVFSLDGKNDIDRMARGNPLVETGDIGSILAGIDFVDTSGVVTSRIRVDLEQSLATMTGTTNFTQATVDVRVGFPTFGTQRLALRGHGVATAGDAPPMARYAYVGGSGTLPVLDNLEQGGSELFFLETRYIIPIAKHLPVVGAPSVTLRHVLGSAGVGSLPSLDQEIGAGVGLAEFRFDVTHDVSSNRGTRVSAGISLGHD